MALSGQTCRACLRRLARPFFGIGSSSSSTPVTTTTTTTAPAATPSQIRTKSTTRQAQDQGVVVRLLRDIPKFGREHAIFRVERGRMRNEWYPAKKAEYMTAQRFKDLGLTRRDIGERDRSFVPLAELETAEEHEAKSAPGKPIVPLAKVPQIKPEVFRELLATGIPETLSFFRKPIPAPPPAPAAKISPLVASSMSTPPPANTATGIFGSVSASDVVQQIKELMSAEPQLASLQLAPEHIRFLGLDEGSDRLKALGRWEVEISVNSLVPGVTNTTAPLAPIRKMIEVLPAE